MGTGPVAVLLRISMILLIMTGITMLFVTPGEPEFYISLITMIINAAVVAAAYIFLKKKSDR